MKLQKNPRWLSPAFLVLGIAGLVLRLLLYRFATDDKGLLTPNHPLELTLWALTALGVVLAFLFAGKEAHPRRDEHLEALGEFMGAVGIAITVPSGLDRAVTVLDGIHLGLGLVAAVALCYSAVLRWQRKSAPILCCSAVCLFMALHLVCRYRVWSAQPQFQSFIFSLAGGLCAMFFAYLRICEGRFRLRRVTGLIGCLCCLTAMSHSSDPALCLGCGIWMITNLHAPGDPE